MDVFTGSARQIITTALDDMRTSIGGATPATLDWRPGGDETNSIAVLAVHALHSTRMWLATALDARRPDRDRDAEFITKAVDADSLLSLVDALGRDCLALLSRDGAIDWSAMRDAHSRPGSDEAREVPAAWALMHALEHLREHVGVMMLTRQLADARGG